MNRVYPTTGGSHIARRRFQNRRRPSDTPSGGQVGGCERVLTTDELHILIGIVSDCSVSLRGASCLHATATVDREGNSLNWLAVIQVPSENRRIYTYNHTHTHTHTSHHVIPRLLKLRSNTKARANAVRRTVRYCSRACMVFADTAAALYNQLLKPAVARCKADMYCFWSHYVLPRIRKFRRRCETCRPDRRGSLIDLKTTHRGKGQQQQQQARRHGRPSPTWRPWYWDTLIILSYMAKKPALETWLKYYSLSYVSVILLAYRKRSCHSSRILPGDVRQGLVSYTRLTLGRRATKKNSNSSAHGVGEQDGTA